MNYPQNEADMGAVSSFYFQGTDYSNQAWIFYSMCKKVKRIRKIKFMAINHSIIFEIANW